MGSAVTRIVPIGLLLLMWEVITRAGWINPFVFPPVSEVAV